jgi:hypothetical protein
VSTYFQHPARIILIQSQLRDSSLFAEITRKQSDSWSHWEQVRFEFTKRRIAEQCVYNAIACPTVLRTMFRFNWTSHANPFLDQLNELRVSQYVLFMFVNDIHSLRHSTIFIAQ